jgi:NosR/NirI family transcriptional regulator, nitrous oxide reductase regulator
MLPRVTTGPTRPAQVIRGNSPLRRSWSWALTGLLPLLALATMFSPFVMAEPRFPPPDFESGYKLPVTPVPAARSLTLEYLDVVVLAAALGLACYLVLKRRSRSGVIGLSLFSLAYFGFYREGCICAIGAVQNLVTAWCDPAYALPLPALAFFVLPLVVALFAGRAFCAAVCPHGALQDLVLLRPVKVPPWLEHSLGLVPYIYLGAAVAFAATGSAFIICRYDPFVPLFRLSGSMGLLLLGGAFLLIGMFVGRPYCRFLCPYGALLRLASMLSKWRVTITPGLCSRCRLCENSCPYGAIQEPTLGANSAEALTIDRRRLGWMLLLLPVLVLSGGLVGSSLASQASKAHRTVALSERYLRERSNPVPLGIQSAAALALNRANEDPKALLSRAVEIRQRFVRTGWIFGLWMGLVIGLKLIALCLRHTRNEYAPDRGACVSCARCFASCPDERVRAGLNPIGPALGAEIGPTATLSASQPAGVK